MRLVQHPAVRPRLPWRHAAIAVAISFAVAAGYFLRLHDAAPFSALEAQTLAWRFQIRGPIAPPQTVAILTIDDRTIARTNAWPMPRAVLAEAVTKARAGGAQSIGIDLLFLEFEPPTDGLVPGPGDQALRVALPAAGGQYQTLAKASSLAAAIGYPDIMQIIGGTIASQTSQALEAMVLVILLYGAINLAIALVVGLANRRLLARERR